MTEKKYQLTIREFLHSLLASLTLNKKVFIQINNLSEVKFYQIVFIYIGTALVSITCFIFLLLLVPVIAKLGLFPTSFSLFLEEVLVETLPVTFLEIQICILLAIVLQIIINCLLNPSLLINNTKLNKYFLSISYASSIFLWLWVSLFLALFLTFPFEDYFQDVFLILILVGLSINFINSTYILVSKNRIKLAISCLWPLIFILKLF